MKLFILNEGGTIILVNDKIDHQLFKFLRIQIHVHILLLEWYNFSIPFISKFSNDIIRLHGIACTNHYLFRTSY